MGTFYIMYSEFLHYNKVVNEILPFNQEVLCETMDYAWFHIRKKPFFSYDISNLVNSKELYDNRT